MRAGLILFAGVLLVGCGASQPQDRQFSLQVQGGTLADGGDSLEVSRGDRVTLAVSSDASVELHLHGYDITASAAPERPASIAFTANATGSFPLTVHRLSAPEQGSSHASHAETVPAPEGMGVTIAVHADAADGFNVHIMPTGFTFSPERVNEAHVAGEGHAHIYLDGVKLGRVYGPYYHLTGVPAGEHEVRVTLNANSHEGYARDGEQLAATAVVVGADADHADDHEHGDHDEEEATLLRLEVRP